MNKNEQMECVLLYTLVEIGGSGSKQAVLSHIQNSGYWRVNDANDEYLSSRPSEYKWRNRFAYCRLNLVEKGFMNNTGHNIWGISAEGYTHLESLKAIALNETDLTIVDFTATFQNKLAVNTCYENDDIADFSLLERLTAENDSITSVSTTPVSLVNTPLPKGPSTISKGNRRVYIRDAKIAYNALIRANHQCEIDSTHTSFIRRSSSQPYMEPHHFIPMAFTDTYNVNLDREQNIICLCSNCHNQIHYGVKSDVREMIDKLHTARQHELSSILGRNIDKGELYSIYRVEEDPDVP